MNNSINSIGKKLKLARQNAKKTLREVEEETGISNSYISLMENNHRDPNFKMLKTLADCYGVSLAYFVAPETTLEALSPEEREFFEELLRDEKRKTMLRESRGMSDDDLAKVIKIIKAFNDGKLD